MSEVLTIDSVLSTVRKPTETAPPPPKVDFSDFRITLKTEVPKLEPTIIIDKSWLCIGGGIMLVSGQKKAGKSNGLVYVLATALMKDVEIENTLMIRSNYTTKKIIYIDTEQEPAQTKDFVSRIMKIAKLQKEPTNLMMYNIRSLDQKERMTFLFEYIMSLTDIAYLVIDGVADMFVSVNDEEKAREFVDNVYKRLDKQASLICTIHEGKDNNGATGHLGQILERKCSGTIAFFKDRKTSTHRMACKLVRYTNDFEDIHFMYDTEQKGFVLLNEAQRNALKEKTDVQKNNELIEIIKQCFKVSKTLDKDALKLGFRNYDKSLNLQNSKDSIDKNISRKIIKGLELEIIEFNNQTKLYTVKS